MVIWYVTELLKELSLGLQSCTGISDGNESTAGKHVGVTVKCFVGKRCYSDFPNMTEGVHCGVVVYV